MKLGHLLHQAYLLRFQLVPESQVPGPVQAAFQEILIAGEKSENGAVMEPADANHRIDFVGNALQRFEKPPGPGIPPHRHLDTGEVEIQVVERSELQQQVTGRLGSNGRHPRHVVRGVANEGQEVSNLPWLDAETLDDLVGSDHPVPHGVPQQDPVSDQLREILIGCDDDHLQTASERPIDRAGDQIISFHSLLLEDRNRERLDDLSASIHL